MRIRIRDGKFRIRDQHPGSATLVKGRVPGKSGDILENVFAKKLK
jgi:hypothetical protein